jgi:hypothetical protein
MVSKGASIAVLVVGMLVLVGGLGMSDTQTITGSTDVPRDCVDTGFGQECYGGGTINSQTTVDNPTKGPTILSGLVLTAIGFVLTLASGGSNDDESFAEQRKQKKKELAMDGSGSSSTVDTDGGSAVETEVNQAPTSPVDERPRQQPQSEEPRQSQTVTFFQEYNDEIKYYGSIIGGIIVTYYLVSFLLGPTFLMDGFIGRVVTLLSWIGGGLLGRRFHERRFQQEYASDKR